MNRSSWFPVSVGVSALTHGVPHVDVALVSPVVALREGLPIGEHVTFVCVWALSKAVIIQPRSPVVDVTVTKLSVSCRSHVRKPS